MDTVGYDLIGLEEMDKVCLMNRIDTKFWFHRRSLAEMFHSIQPNYFILSINGITELPYLTEYFDTLSDSMYIAHHNGKLNRYKIRRRSYVSSGISFLEVKFSNNKGRTIKRRVITPLNQHALIDIDREKAKDAIIKLSQMMDYMLYESKSQRISLKQEMDFTRSYVNLMRLRITDEVDLKLQIPDTLPQIQIPPLLSISFIENAFKYGISYQSPSFIHICVNVSNGQFVFKVENSMLPLAPISAT